MKSISYRAPSALRPQRSFGVVLVFVVLLLAESVSATKIYVKPFRVDPKSPISSEAATQIAALRLQKVRGITVIDEESVKELLNFESEKQLLGVDDVGGLSAIGELVDADELVYGTVDVVAGTLVSTLLIINVAKKEVSFRVARTARSKHKDLVVRSLASASDAILANWLSTHTLLSDNVPRKFKRRPHPLAYVLLGAGAGTAAGAGIAHAWTPANEPVAYAVPYAAAGALLIAGTVFLITGALGERYELKEP